MVWLVSTSSSPQSPRAMPQSIDRFSSLPPELIQRIFDLACDWDEYGRDLSAHYGPLSKRLFPLQLRSIYSRFCPKSCSDIERFDSTLLGTERAVITRKLLLYSYPEEIHDALPLFNLLPRLTGLVDVDLGERKEMLTACFLNHVSAHPDHFRNLRLLECPLLSEQEEEGDRQEEEKEQTTSLAKPQSRGLRPLRYLPRLVKLYIIWWDHIVITRPNGLSLPELRELTIYGGGGGPGLLDNLALISCCPNLHELYLAMDGMGDPRPLLQQLPPSIRSLRLSGPGIKLLGQLVYPFENLTSLSLDSECIDNTLMDFLLQIPALQCLELTFEYKNIPVVEEVLRLVPRLPSLCEIYLTFEWIFWLPDDKRVDLTDKWLDFYRRIKRPERDLSFLLEDPDFEADDLSRLDKLVEEMKGRGLNVVVYGLKQAQEDGKLFVVERNNRTIVKVIATDSYDPDDFDYLQEIAERYDFPLPEYKHKWFTIGEWVVVRKEVPKQDWFLLVLEHSEPRIGHVDEGWIRKPMRQGTLDEWLGIA